MEASLEIRIALAQDAEPLAGLAIAFRNHLGREVPSDQQFRAGVERMLASPDAEFLLAGTGPDPVGYLLLRYRFSMWAGGLEATIEDLFVAPGDRRRGAGKALVQAALDRAGARGCVSACLDTNEKNLASTRIYTQLGFDAFSARWQGRQLFFRKRLQEAGRGQS